MVHSRKDRNIAKRFVRRLLADEQVFYKPGCEIFVQEVPELFVRGLLTVSQYSFLVDCALYDELERRKVHSERKLNRRPPVWRNISHNKLVKGNSAIWLQGKRR